jgi:hypothetical protein
MELTGLLQQLNCNLLFQEGTRVTHLMVELLRATLDTTLQKEIAFATNVQHPMYAPTLLFPKECKLTVDN